MKYLISIRFIIVFTFFGSSALSFETALASTKAFHKSPSIVFAPGLLK